MWLSLSRRLTVGIVLSVELAACGGGGGSGGSSPPPTFTIGGSVSGLAAGESVTLADNVSDTVSVSSNTTFVFPTAINQSGSYAVTVKTQPPAQSCTVSAGSGSGLMANVTTVMVTCANSPQYAYVVNNGADNVSQYAIDASGTLSALGVATVSTGRAPESVTVDPSHKYVYVTNFTDDTISQYIIQNDGTLSPNTPATVATGHGPWAFAMNPSGTFAYVVNSTDSNISLYSVNSSGALTLATPGPFGTGNTPWNITLSPDGKYVYVANHGNAAPGGQTLSQYAIDATTGALTPLNPATVATAFPYPGGITVDPTSSYAYLSNINGDSISEFGIGTAGTLTSLNPASVPAGAESTFLAFDPTGKYAYEANYTIDVSSPPGTVSQYTVGSSGQLMPMTPATVTAGNGPAWIAFDPFGKYAFVVNIGDGTTPGTVSEYAIGSSGDLTLIGTATAGLKPYMIATTY